MSLIPAWVKATRDAEIPTGLTVDDLLRRAFELRENLRAGTISPAAFRLVAKSVETLHALGAVLDQAADVNPKVLLADVSGAFKFISTLEWPKDEFGGRQDLLSRFAFLGWRYARQAESSAAESEWRSTHSSIAGSSVRANVEQTLAVPIELRLERFDELNLENSEELLSVSTALWGLGEIEPAGARDEAAFFYRFLETPMRSIGTFDERDYFLGEFSLIAGAACRILSKREEAKQWLDLAEASFILAQHAGAHLARLAYQRLALKVEERDFDEVVESAPVWAERFKRLGLAEESLKCRFLEGAAYRELGRVFEAIDVFEGICTEAEAESNTRLLAQAANGLAQFYRVVGNLKEALAYAKRALPLLQKLNNRVNLAKLRWCVGDIFREQGREAEALDSYRLALTEAQVIGIRGDVVALRLVVADLLLDAGRDAQAEREIRAALPIIEEEKMMPEGMAALTLLRESVRRRQINRQALRDLHGYFRNPNA